MRSPEAAVHYCGATITVKKVKLLSRFGKATNSTRIAYHMQCESHGQNTAAQTVPRPIPPRRRFTFPRRNPRRGRGARSSITTLSSSSTATAISASRPTAYSIATPGSSRGLSFRSTTSRRCCLAFNLRDDNASLAVDLTNPDLIQPADHAGKRHAAYPAHHFSLARHRLPACRPAQLRRQDGRRPAIHSFRQRFRRLVRSARRPAATPRYANVAATR